MNINFYPLARGLASYVLPKNLFSRPGSGGTFSSRYCYSVWLRHLTHLLKNGLINDVSQLQRVAEIGPGDSLGVGISALFTGASKYYCFDVIKHASTEGNGLITAELERLFCNQTEIPHGNGFENVSPRLENYSFPAFLQAFNAQYYLQRSKQVQRALKESLSSEISIEYIVPWTTRNNQSPEGLDLIFSQAVMEHVADIHFAYLEMYKWLKRGGVISHQIDFKTHEMTKKWNGHWFISNGMWKILARGRKYPMNRLPLSSHLKAIRDAGFTIRVVHPVTRENDFRITPTVDAKFDEQDLITSGALIQAVKE